MISACVTFFCWLEDKPHSTLENIKKTKEGEKPVK
jgi:hypothetical protein